MGRITRFCAAVAMMILPAAVAAGAGQPVDVALVLVSDVSRSIDDSEYMLQKQGYLRAFADPRVVQAIQSGTNGAIAVAYVEFASAPDVKTVVDWRVLRDAASAAAFGQALMDAPRTFAGRTAISAGIDHAAGMLAENPFEPTRRVIDVCGDGTNNAGRDVGAARDQALDSGLVINGLTIINDHPVSWTFAHVQPPGGLTKYYRENVAGGPGSFVLEIHDFSSFGDAMTRKLISEISLAVPPHGRFAGR